MARNSRRRGFTLVEMLVVMAIIAILAGLILSTAWRSRLKAYQTTCLNNMRQLGMARMGAGSGHGDESLVCPMGATYALNRRAQSEREACSNPSCTVMLFESQDVTIGSESDVYKVHNGGSNYIYWDGHAEWSKTVPKFGPP